MRSTQGLPVVTRSAAERVGHVERLVVSGGRVRSLGVGDGRLVDWGDVTAVGDDAVVISDGDCLRGPVHDSERRALDHDVSMLGRWVLDEHGDRVGQLDDVIFDAGDGTVEALEVGSERLAGDRLGGVGSYAVVVAARTS